MTLLHGFELLREQWVAERKTLARYMRHAKTGAELLLLENDDENKAFTIAFRTPPSDSTGIAHILEHSVLCGSRKYPLKEPFIELVKGSLKTFLNAFTGQDGTYYPVASQNLKDFYNLVDVYLDAVFHPAMTPRTLEQEGWHYELNSIDEPMTYKGVVYNEMKGAHSSPDREMYSDTLRAMFPDNVYGLDSGGDPAVMPSLTWTQFQEFHHTYYHPSNARIVFYGDDRSDERLSMLDSYLSEFDRREIDSHIALQHRFEAPVRAQRPYATDDPTSERCMVGMGWLLSNETDPETVLTFEVLQKILIGTPAAPLRKALAESGLVEDVGGGVENLRQQSFILGLKGVKRANMEKAEALVMDTLASLALSGIDIATIEGALNTAEFALRENNSGSFPRGLSMAFAALGSWFYDGDPIAPLCFEAPLAALKAHVEGGGYFEGILKDLFLANPHRVTLLLAPDVEMHEREDAAERARLLAARSAMTPEQVAFVISETAALKEAQERPDSEEALATLPRLHRSDLDLQNMLVPSVYEARNGADLYYHDLFTAGVVYFDLGLNLHTLPANLLPYVPLLGRSFTEMGTGAEDYVRITQRIAGRTGGIRRQLVTSGIRGANGCVAHLFLRAKAMHPQTKDLLGILRDVLVGVKLDNRERFRQMALEERTRLEASLPGGGHQYADARMRAHFTEAGWVGEQMGGISYLLFLRELVPKIEGDWPSVLSDLEQAMALLINRNAMTLNVTADGADWTAFSRELDDFLAEMPAAQTTPAVWRLPILPQREAFTIPSQVNYVGQAFNIYDAGYVWKGSATIVTTMLNTSFLWEQVRVLGGAYGGFCRFDPFTGIFSFISYRDPNLRQTLATYRQAGDYLTNLSLSEDELLRSIIGAIGEMDAYHLPDAKGFSSLLRTLVGDTDIHRQQRRVDILSATLSDFREFGAALRAGIDRGVVGVVGSPTMIAAAAQTEAFEVVKLL